MDLPLDRWPALRPLGPDPVVETPTTGTMNDTWIVSSRTTARRYVLRRHRFRDSDRIRGEHRVMAHVRNRDIPVPAILPTDAGDSLVSHDERWWTLYGFATGTQIPRDEVTEAHARAMGTALGGIHAALADLDSGTEPAPPANDAPAAEELLLEIGALRSIIGAMRDRTAQDDWADDELAGHAAWIERYGLPEPEAVPDDEVQVLHGDYQESNLFFAGSPSGITVTGVIDWDKAEIGARGFEVVRCLKLSLSFNPALCRAFLDGYRSTAELTTPQLRRSVHNEHARALRGLWLPQMIYRHGEDRLRRFLRPGGFRTVLDGWPPEVE